MFKVFWLGGGPYKQSVQCYAPIRLPKTTKGEIVLFKDWERNKRPAVILAYTGIRDSNSDRQVSTHKSLSICHIWSRTSIKVMDTVVPALTDQHQRHGESPRHSILVTWGRHWRWSGDWFLWSTTSKRLISSTWDSQTSQGLKLDWQQRPLFWYC